MLEACGIHQIGDSSLPPSIGTPRQEPDPVNHETLNSVSDRGIDGHDTSDRGIDDALLAPPPTPQAAYA